MAKILKNCMYGLIVFLFVSVVFPPLFSVFNKIDPFVLGMPFLQFWLLVVNFGVAVALIVIWRVDEKGVK